MLQAEETQSLCPANRKVCPNEILSTAEYPPQMVGLKILAVTD